MENNGSSSLPFVTKGDVGYFVNIHKLFCCAHFVYVGMDAIVNLNFIDMFCVSLCYM
jgi:hypothetical protein